MAKSLAEDLYSDKLLNNPCSVYKQIRDLGSAVWAAKDEAVANRPIRQGAVGLKERCRLD